MNSKQRRAARRRSWYSIKLAIEKNESTVLAPFKFEVVSDNVFALTSMEIKALDEAGLKPLTSLSWKDFPRDKSPGRKVNLEE